MNIIAGILESSIIHDAVAKDYGIKLMKITKLDFDLPKAYIRAMCKEFQVLEYGDMPKMLVRPSLLYGDMLHTHKVHISTDEIAIMKFHERTEVDARKLVKEVCVYKHLEKLQGYRIPKLLLYGVPGSLRPNIIIESPGFFFIVEFYGEVLGPSQVSAPELGEILNDIHGHGILLGCREFPRVTRNGSMLMLVDMAEAVFDENKDRLKTEFQYLTSLCKGE